MNHHIKTVNLYYPIGTAYQTYSFDPHSKPPTTPLFSKLLTNLKATDKLVMALKTLFYQGPHHMLSHIKTFYFISQLKTWINAHYQHNFHSIYPSSSLLIKQQHLAQQLTYQPKISLIMPVYNPNPQHLTQAIQSVINQSYSNWELCIADDASPNPQIKTTIKNLANKDNRIKYIFRSHNGHICHASNSALNLATGDYVGFLDHDDFLWPNALFEIVKLINQKPKTLFIYTNEDKITADNKTHLDPTYKPAWSPNLLSAINYITHFAVIKTNLLKKVGYFIPGTEGAQDWDLFLRTTHHITTNLHPLDPDHPIQHIPKILYSWRQTATSTANNTSIKSTKPYAFSNQKKVLINHIKRTGAQGTIKAVPHSEMWHNTSLNTLNIYTYKNYLPKLIPTLLIHKLNLIYNLNIIYPI